MLMQGTHKMSTLVDLQGRDCLYLLQASARVYPEESASFEPIAETFLSVSRIISDYLEYITLFLYDTVHLYVYKRKEYIGISCSE